MGRLSAIVAAGAYTVLMQQSHDRTIAGIAHDSEVAQAVQVAPHAAAHVCVDYSVAKGGPLVAYRFDGEPTLAAEKFVAIQISTACDFPRSERSGC